MPDLQETSKIAIVGAAGRMGRMLIQMVLESPRAELIAILEHPEHPAIGTDAGTLIGGTALGIPLTQDRQAILDADVVIDFTDPDSTCFLTSFLAQSGVAHIIGTTGLNDVQSTIVRDAAQIIPIVWAPNFSMGVTLLRYLTHLVASRLESSFDIEILEMHHKHKVDAPSGTALGLGHAAAQGRKISLDRHGIFTRHGQTGSRPQGDIGFATLRGGDVVGDHTVMFAGSGERLELTHKAQDRSVFASGAVRAALWVTDRSPGLYDMMDVLEIHTT